MRLVYAFLCGGGAYFIVVERKEREQTIVKYVIYMKKEVFIL